MTDNQKENLKYNLRKIRNILNEINGYNSTIISHVDSGLVINNTSISQSVVSEVSNKNSEVINDINNILLPKLR